METALAWLKPNDAAYPAVSWCLRSSLFTSLLAKYNVRHAGHVSNSLELGSTYCTVGNLEVNKTISARYKRSKPLQLITSTCPCTFILRNMFFLLFFFSCGEETAFYLHVADASPALNCSTGHSCFKSSSPNQVRSLLQYVI